MENQLGTSGLAGRGGFVILKTSQSTHVIIKTQGRQNARVINHMENWRDIRIQLITDGHNNGAAHWRTILLQDMCTWLSTRTCRESNAEGEGALQDPRIWLEYGLSQ